MQGWGFRASPVISGAKDLISSAFSNAKRGGGEGVIKEENKAKYSSSFFFAIGELQGNAFKKKSVEMKTFSSKKVRATHSYHLCVCLPTGASSPTPLVQPQKSKPWGPTPRPGRTAHPATRAGAPRELPQPGAARPAGGGGWPAGTGGQQSSVQLRAGGQSPPGTAALRPGEGTGAAGGGVCVCHCLTVSVTSVRVCTNLGNNGPLLFEMTGTGVNLEGASENPNTLPRLEDVAGEQRRLGWMYEPIIASYKFAWY